MAIEKVIEIKANVSAANKNLKEVNTTLEEQREILIELERELLKAERQQASTSKTNLAAQKQITEQVDHLKDSIKDQRLSLRELNSERRQASDILKESAGEQANQSKLIKVADKLTGGFATKIKTFYNGLIESSKAVKLFTLGLSGMQKALIATGIGALVVALGLVIAYWDDIKGFVDGVGSAQKQLNVDAEKNLEIQKEKLSDISDQENILKLQGKSEKDILNIKKAQLDEVIKASELQIEQSIATLKSQKEASQRNKDILSGMLKFVSLPITALLSGIDLIGKAFGKDFGLMKGFDDIAGFVFDPDEVEEEGDLVIKEQQKALDKLKNQKAGFDLQIKSIDKQSSDKAKAERDKKDQQQINDEKERVAALERIRQAEIDTEAERRAEQLRQIRKQYEDLILEAEKYGQDTNDLKEAQRTKEKELQDRFDLEDAEAQKVKDDKKKAADDKRIAEEMALNNMLIQAEVDLQAAKRNALDQGLNMMLQFAGKNKAIALTILAIQKGLAIADVIVGASKSIATATASMAPTPLNPAFIGPVPNPGFITNAIIAKKSILTTKIGAAANIASIVSAGISSAKSISGSAGGGGGSSAGGGGGGGGSTPPAFNVVGTSGVNQIAQQLGQQQDPIEAYVVGSNVTTQQEMDRNIVTTATLG